MDSSAPSFNKTFMKAMASSSAPYPDFTAKYEMSFDAIFFDFPEKPKSFDDVSQILEKMATTIFNATDSSTLIHAVETYKNISERCLCCIKGLTDNLNLGALEIKDCWTRSSHFEHEAGKCGQKLITAEHKMDHQVKHISNITKAYSAQKDLLEECIKEREHEKENYRWLTELRDLYTKLEADHKICKDKFKAFEGMLKENEELKKEIEELKIENAQLTVENYNYEAVADLKNSSTNQNSPEVSPKSYSVNVNFPGKLSIVEDIGSAGSIEALLSMTIGLKRTESKNKNPSGQAKQTRKGKSTTDSSLFQVSKETPSEGETVSEANSKSTEDATGASQEVSRVTNPLPIISEEMPVMRRVTPKKRYVPRKRPGNVGKLELAGKTDNTSIKAIEESPKAGGTNGFINSPVPKTRCVKLSNIPAGAKASDFCRIIRGGKLEQIILQVQFGKPIALVYFFDANGAEALHEWIQKTPRLTINQIPVESKILLARKAATSEDADESRVIRVPLPAGGVTRSELVQDFCRLANKIDVATSALQTVATVQDADGTLYAEYAFDGRNDAKKFLEEIKVGHEHLKFFGYGRDPCEQPLHVGDDTKSWVIGPAQPDDQGSASE
ncbi:hypothetical protein L873DRAFT_1508238 [Choiromyces venosus 120613-1]|uniref:Uncharacterized protein n=1 Tax=Choiromyces venosus 120613-1 TaxID=1336337 RepID=A0A3N4J6D4_9PEZI|nr:hypothetical protein L873DRAFT_1508238 [Choiromyces venosus 120613-1]